MFKAPAIFFPSTVVFFDDDPLYARLLIDRLRIPRLKHFESLEFLLKQKGDDFLFVDGDIFRKVDINDFEYVKNNLSTIKKSGTMISVIVSDLHMENCSGTQLFSQIASPYVGRILVSNFIDYQKTSDIQEARNNGFVDMLLDKTKNFVEDLPKAIWSAKMKFFTALSNSLYGNACGGHPLEDTEFAKFFIAKIEELKPEEIIANSTFNRFTFVLDDKQPNVVINVADKNEIQSYLESSAAESAPPELLKHLSSGQYILCHGDDFLPDGRKWPLFIRPARPLDGKNNRYYYNISEAQQ